MTALLINVKNHTRLCGIFALVLLMSIASTAFLAPHAAYADSAVVNMYRLYNPNSGEHFYTQNLGEAKHVAEVGWRWEGIGWVAPVEGDPVYRLYNPNAGDHHYTLSIDERDWLVTEGWIYEGVGWNSASADGYAVLRQYNPNAKAGAHNFTTSSDEDAMLGGVGWTREGVAWYASRSNNPAVTPFWLVTPAWGSLERYWIDATGSVARNRKITPEEGAGYTAYAGSTGAVYRNSAYVMDGQVYDFNNDGVMGPPTSERAITLQRALDEVNQCTNPSMTQEQKLRACFDHLVNDVTERNPRIPHTHDAGWETLYANDIFVGRAGNCFSFGAAFAYMAKALGYTDVYACNSGGHGWAEVNGRVFDPENAKNRKGYSYYNMGYYDPCDTNYRSAISANYSWMHVAI